MSEAKSELKKLQVTAQWLQVVSMTSPLGSGTLQGRLILASAEQLSHAAATSCSQALSCVVSSCCVLACNLIKLDSA